MSMTTAKFYAYGYTRIWRVYDDRKELVIDAPNQLTDGFFDVITSLLLQRADIPAETPEYNKLHSVWFEASNSDIAEPSVSDTTYDALSTIVAQKIVTDSNKSETILALGHRVASVRARLEKAEANGSRLVAVNLCTRGESDTPPSPTGFTNGTNRVNIVARQPLGPFEKNSAYGILIEWDLYVRAEDA